MFLKLRLPPPMLVPALATRMSMRPWRFSMSAAAAMTAFLSATSSLIASASPRPFSFFSASRFVFSVRPEMTTRMPAFSSSSAPASPIPDPPPVIQATLPLGILSRAKEVLALLLRHLGTATVGEHGERLLHRRALVDRVAPGLQRRILVDVHALALGEAQPRHGRHVGDGVLVARQVLRLLQAPVDHHVEAV